MPRRAPTAEHRQPFLDMHEQAILHGRLPLDTSTSITPAAARAGQRPRSALMRPSSRTRLASACADARSSRCQVNWKSEHSYSHRQGRVIFELRLTNQPGSRACPSGVPVVRGDSSRPDRPAPGPGRCLPGEPARVAPNDAPGQIRPALRCPRVQRGPVDRPPCLSACPDPAGICRVPAPARPDHCYGEVIVG